MKQAKTNAERQSLNNYYGYDQVPHLRLHTSKEKMGNGRKRMSEKKVEVTYRSKLGMKKNK